MDVVAKLREFQSAQGLSTNKLATLAGLSQSTVRDALADERKAPSIPTLEKLCDALGLTLAEFFAENEKQVDPKESELLATFRALPDDKKEQAIRVVKSL